jgi:hypothetical protein
MHEVNEVIKVICEGRSEAAYLNQINHFLKENGVKTIFLPIPTYGGHFNVIRKKLQQLGYLRKKAVCRNEKVIIWVDKDVYERNEQKNQDKYEDFIKKYPLLFFHFNRFSFEDFYILHEESENVRMWYNICRKKGHFSEKPLTSQISEELIKEILPGYKKGEISTSFISINSLKNLFINNGKYEFKSDIVDFLRPILSKILLKYFCEKNQIKLPSSSPVLPIKPGKTGVLNASVPDALDVSRQEWLL